MARHTSQDSLECPTGLFDQQEEDIAKATSDLNEASSASEKKKQAQKLLDATDRLLACADHDPTRRDCQICWEVAKLRQKVANLAITVSGLDAPD